MELYKMNVQEKVDTAVEALIDSGGLPYAIQMHPMTFFKWMEELKPWRFGLTTLPNLYRGLKLIVTTDAIPDSIWITPKPAGSMWATPENENEIPSSH